MGLIFGFFASNQPKQISFKKWANNYFSHKKRKDSLEGSLDRVLFAAEPEFSKILVPKLPYQMEALNVPEYIFILLF